jgi:glycerol kinase
MSEPLLLALDQGTTSTRAALYGLDGRERAAAQRPLRQSYPADGWVEHDPEEIFAGSVAVLREALAAAGDARVAALGVTNQRETAVVWDRETGRAIASAIVWQDRRTAAACEELRSRGVEPDVARRTGLRLDPYFSATKWSCLLDSVDGARTAAGAGRLLCGTVDSWLVWRLTGGRVHATDPTNACRTLLFDLERQAWDPELCALFGVPIASLPEVRDTAGDFGEVEAGVLGRPVPIRAAAGDQQAALMGQGCVRAGQAKATYGTGAFLLLHTGEAVVRSEAGLLTSVAARIGGAVSFCVEGSIFNAGAAVQWVAEAFDVEGGPAAVERLAGQAKPDHGVILVPAFTGLGAPWWDSEARGALFGLTRDSSLPEIAAAAIDAAAHQTGDLLEAMRAAFPAALGGDAPLRIDGGMAGSRAFAARLADLTGAAVDRADYTEATALGAAMFAGIGAGLLAGPEEAARMRPEAETFRPKMNAEARAAARSRWLDAVGRVVGRAPGA